METLQIQPRKDIIRDATANRDGSLANDFFGTFNENIAMHILGHGQWLASHKEKLYESPKQAAVDYSGNYSGVAGNNYTGRGHSTDDDRYALADEQVR